MSHSIGTVICFAFSAPCPGPFAGQGGVRRKLEPVRVVDTPLATHLKYRFVR
ncbi:hypothetical protein [Streptomyces sp. NPDC001537]